MSKQTEHPQNSGLQRGPLTNLFLANLGRADYDAVMQKSRIVRFKLRQKVMLQDERVTAVYFPITCMFSLLVTSTTDLPQMEMATVGREGVAGATEAIQDRGAIGLHLIQLPGTAVRIAADAFRELARERPGLQQTIHQHTYALMRQILYGASCNRIHSIEEGCARWLLMTQDRACEDTFPLTQEFLSHMLGVRRATVNIAAGGLKKAGLIKYVRGKLTVLDRPGLESAACVCYAAITKVYEAVLPLGPELAAS